MKREFSEEKKNLIFIKSSNNVEGANSIATTAGTISTWLNLDKDQQNINLPSHILGHCHGNVEMPYSLRIEKILRLFLLKENVKGNQKRPLIAWNSSRAYDTLISVYKDEIARVFYQEICLRKFIKEFKK